MGMVSRIRWTGGGDGDEEGDGVAGWEGLREVGKDRGTRNLARLLESMLHADRALKMDVRHFFRERKMSQT